MHEYRARPALGSANKLVSANQDQLPFLDVFIIKLFAAPCKFADSSPSATADVNGTKLSACSISPQQHAIESRDLRTIAPDMRIELTRIATSTLRFLEKVVRVDSLEIAYQLRSEKASLLKSLESWLKKFEMVQMEIGPEPIAVSFLRLFHIVLKVILLGVLDSSHDLDAELRTEHDRLQRVANIIGERVKTYIMCSGSSKDWRQR